MMIRVQAILIGFLMLSVLAVLPGQTNHWPQWRGDDFDGVSDAKNLPAEWSETKNIKWKAPMPGESAATPAIWGNHIFVSSVDDRTQDLLALCVKRDSGDIAWSKRIGIDFGNFRRHNKASPSPVTDGERAYFLYGTGDLAALDFEGNIIWQRNLEKEFGKLHIQWGYGSSPLLYDGKIYIQVLRRNRTIKDGETADSFLLAVNPKTGKDLWKHVRPSDARAESLEAYTTPIPFEWNGREEIIVFGADYATGHNPDTGEELWRWGNYNPNKIGHWRIVPSAVSGNGHVYVAAPKRQPLFAIKAGGKGELNDEWIDWKLTDYPPDVCTPAFHNGRLYVLDGDRYVMTCVDAKSGEKIWEGELDSQKVMRASPTIADGKIYCHNEDGVFWVLEDGDEFKILSKIEMGEGPIRASFAFSDNELFIRTAENLYCVSKTE